MIIDGTHKKWIWATVLLTVVLTSLYLLLDWLEPGELTGGSTVGLIYGSLGSLIMLFVGALALHRYLPAWSIFGPRKTWLRGHIWLGLLSAPVILCHSNFSFGGPLEQVLMLVMALTLLTGVYGLLLQHFLPRMLTLRIGSETPYEQIPYVCEVMRQRADKTMADMWKAGPSPAESGGTASFGSTQGVIGSRVQFQEFYEQHVRPFLTPRFHRRSMLADPLKADAAFNRLRALPGLNELKAEVSFLEQLCDDRRQLADQERLHFWLHNWVPVHVALSLALLVLAIAHVVMSLYY